FNAGTPVVCGVEASTPQAVVVCAASMSRPVATVFPDSLARVKGEAGKRKTSVAGLGQVLVDCYDQWKLPAELGASWAEPAAVVQVPDPSFEPKPSVTVTIAGDTAPAYMPAG
ncbi:MAG: hypothetical protein JWM57_1188, partial [Phycisphaerales bacterium]|nr:hypothetical protein [Phycisphaerales bacterium]